MIIYSVFGAVVTACCFFSTAKKHEKFYMVCCLILMMFFAGLRGDFTSDHKNYIDIYHFLEMYGLKNIVKSGSTIEIGFLFYTKIMTFFGSDVLYIFLISAITIIFFYVVIKKYSFIPYLSLLLYIGMGNYYIMFNLSRQIFAVSIMFLGSKYLFERNFKYYFLFVIIAMCFHTTAIIMLPMYFLLNMKITKKYLLSIGIIVFSIFISSEWLIKIFQMVLPRYSVYTKTAYGMQGGSVGNIVLPSFILTICIFSAFLIKKKNFDINGQQNRICLNAVICMAIFALLSLKVYMAIRLMYYLEPFGWILLPNMIFSYKLEGNKKVVITVITFLALVLPILTLKGTGYDPYYFYWQIN